MSTTTVAWHGDPDLKREVMARLRQHRLEDSIIKGAYQLQDLEAAEQYRGCAIGCTLPQQLDEPDSWHAEVEARYGIPYAIGYLIDDTFEALRDGHADFAVNSIEAVPVGADLSRVLDALTLDMLVDETHGALRWLNPDTEARAAVEAVAELLRCEVAGEDAGYDAWVRARTRVRNASIGLTGYADAACDLAMDAHRDFSPGTDDFDTAWIAERLIAHLSAAPVREVTHA